MFIRTKPELFPFLNQSHIQYVLKYNINSCRKCQSAGSQENAIVLAFQEYSLELHLPTSPPRSVRYCGSSRLFTVLHAASTQRRNHSVTHIRPSIPLWPENRGQRSKGGKRKVEKGRAIEGVIGGGKQKSEKWGPARFSRFWGRVSLAVKQDLSVQH